MSIVLGGGTEHGGAANVNVFHTLRKICSTSDCLPKWIQIDNDEINGMDSICSQVFIVTMVASDRENTAVNFGMQRLYSPAENFW